MLHKIVIIKLSYTETFLFAGFEEASCHIVSFPHHDEGCMSKNWGTPPGDSQQGTKAFSPAAYRELNAANNHMSLEVDHFSVKPHFVA